PGKADETLLPPLRLGAACGLGRLRQGQVNGHWRMIRDAVFDRLIQRSHGDRKVRNEPGALPRTPRILKEWLHQDPVQLEATHQSPEVPAESIGRGESLPNSLVAIG